MLGLALTAAVLACPPAFAASTHPYAETIETGPNCTPRDVATDAEGNVYVVCSAVGLNERIGAVRKFDSHGNPASFTASVPYVSGNEINENPAAPETGGYLTEPAFEFGGKAQIDVDSSSTSPRKGYIYVDDYASGTYGGSGNVDIFAPSGKYVESIKGGAAIGEPSGVGIDQSGNVYVLFEGGSSAHIGKFDPQSWQERERILMNRDNSNYYGPCCFRIRPDSSGAIWVGWGNSFFDGGGYFGKYEADQFSTKLLPAFGLNESAVMAHQSPYLDERFLIDEYPNGSCPETQITNGFGPLACALKGQTFDVDLTNNDVYALPEGNFSSVQSVTPYSQGVAGDPVHQDGPSFGAGTLEGGEGIAIDPSGNVYVTERENKVVKFSRGGTLPTITTNPASVSDIGHTTALLHGVIDPAGGGQIETCKVKYAGTTTPCNETPPYPSGSTKEVSAELTGLTVGHIYHYRFEASNPNGNNFGGERVFEAKAVLNLVTKPPTGVNEHEANLQGELDADGMSTTYHYEYGPSTSYGLETEGATVTGAPGEQLQTLTLLGHLQTGKRYHYRLVATNALGTTRGGDEVFRTASPPEINGVGSENVAETTADIRATIDPVGYDTTYRIEYGATPSYGHSAPTTGNDLGAGTEGQEVVVHLSELPSDTTIHYRVVATNEWGTSVTDDTTFDFRPPACPNGHVREIAGANYLPDCRAYELVSPGYAGAVQLTPAEAYAQFASVFGGSEYPQYPFNFGYASSPSRFAYLGSLGSILGLDAPNSLIDVYLTTRTSTGWVTTLPGLKGNETLFHYGNQCSESMDLCVDHIGPIWASSHGELFQIPKSPSPYLYKADGTRLGRLPTNVGTVKGGTQFKGDEELSGDFSHFIFSTQTKFTPEGETTPQGSVYDNDIAAKTVSVISKLANGSPIPLEPSEEGESFHPTGIVGVSKHGERVLLAGTTQPYCNVNEYPFQCPYILNYPVNLYMRSGNALTYEVSRGKEVYFAGMTRDATKVFFTTAEQLLPEDKDHSSDLYMWEEQGDKLTLISHQATREAREGETPEEEAELEEEEELGNTDGCSASWTEGCGVQPLTPKDRYGSEYFEWVTRVPGIDDVVASESGDIYFYSPQDLVSGEVGGDGQRNLYLYRNGHLRLVTTFEPGTEIERSTISEDGSHAAFLTTSSLTGYDSQHHPEVYTYDADAGSLRCASCNPRGTPPPPSEQVRVGESGPFMANDGRTFFATRESLVPQDTDGIRDVYEYVGGHAQLITSGTGDRDDTGGLEVISLFFGNLQTGLESVSRNGTDVFFSTFDSLVPEDKNGSFLKMYDARSGGGFDYTPELGACAAADECHGAGGSSPPPASIATSGHLGATGNVAAPEKKHGRHRHHKRRHGKRHHRRRGGHRNG